VLLGSVGGGVGVWGTVSGMVSGTLSGTRCRGRCFVAVGGGDSSLVRERRGCLVGGNVGRSDRQQQYYLPVLASLWSMVDGQRRCSVVGQLGDSQQQYYL